MANKNPPQKPSISPHPPRRLGFLLFSAIVLVAVILAWTAMKSRVRALEVDTAPPPPDRIPIANRFSRRHAHQSPGNPKPFRNAGRGQFFRAGHPITGRHHSGCYRRRWLQPPVRFPACITSTAAPHQWHLG
jgi:hypothetical protein